MTTAERLAEKMWADTAYPKGVEALLPYAQALVDARARLFTAARHHSADCACGLHELVERLDALIPEETT